MSFICIYPSDNPARIANGYGIRRDILHHQLLLRQQRKTSIIVLELGNREIQVIFKGFSSWI